MATKIVGEQYVHGLPADAIKIAGVKVRQTYNVTKGPAVVEEIRNEVGDTDGFLLSNDRLDVAFTGLLDPDGTAPESGQEVTVSGWQVAILDAVTVNYQPGGVATVTGTIKCRNKAQA